jgi:CBS domain containing-hemolysin-like protein
MSGTLPIMIALLLASAFFSATETAFTSLSAMQAQALKKTKGQRGALVEMMSKKPEVFLSTVLIGNNIVNMALSALVTSATIDAFGDAAVGASTGILTLLVLTFGEITPKRIAIAHNEFIAIHSVRAIRMLSLAFYPMAKALNAVGSVVAKLFGEGSKRRVTVAGIFQAIRTAESEGVLESADGRMARNVFRLQDATVQGILTHRTVVFSLEASTTVREAIWDVVGMGYDRVPVYEGDAERIVGVVTSSRLFSAWLQGNLDAPVSSLASEPLFVLPTKRANELLKLFRRTGETFAVVMDEYGGFSGIVTMKDLIEEIAGEFADSADEGVPGIAPEKIRRLPDGRLRIEGDTPLHLLKEYSDIDFEHPPQVQTVAGYICASLGRIPVRREKADTAIGYFTIEELVGNRIASVTLEPRAGSSPEGEERS